MSTKKKERKKKGKKSIEYKMSNSLQLALQLCTSSMLVFQVELSTLSCGWSIVLSFTWWFSHTFSKHESVDKFAQNYTKYS